MMERLQTISKIFQTPKQLHDFFMNRGRDAHVPGYEDENENENGNGKLNQQERCTDMTVGAPLL